jgi:hypothetical protein
MKWLLAFRRERPIVWILFWIALTYWIFLLLPLTKERYVDRAILLLLIISFGRALYLMIRRTRIWTWRGQGLLGTVAGDLLLYLALGFGAYLGWRSEVLDLARACLSVGVIHLLIGLEPRNLDTGRIVENSEPARPQGAHYDDI